MALQLQCAVRCASGRVAQFIKAGATSGSIEELTTGGADVNQVSGVSFGQALAGETVTHMYFTVCAPTSTATGFDVGFVTSPQGNVATVVQGGTQFSAMPALYKPLPVQTGMLLKGQSTTAATTVTEATFATYYNDGSCAVYQATGSDGTKANFADVISGATWGQTGSGKIAVAYYCTLNNTNTINEDGNGNNFVYALDAQGQLKGLVSPASSAGSGIGTTVDYISVPIMVHQNDNLSLTYAT